MSSTRKTSVFILLISLVFILAALLVRKEDLDLIPLFPDFKVGWLSSLYAEDYPFTSTIPHNDNIRLGTESKIPKTHDKEGRLSHTRSRVLNRSGVEEHLTTIQQDWKLVVASFFDTAPIAEFSASRIREHYHANENNVKETCMLVTILDGNVTFSEAYSANRHGRASSVKYMVNKIVKEKGKSIPEATFLVMVTDGHKPRVATFGSARHWKNWKLMMPVPLGNERGVREGWGTSLEGWDDYINRNVLSSHAMYSWKLKKPKAVFRGSLSMQTYKLGSCNEENCERPSSWNEVNRGVLYEETRNRPDLFDVGFTYYKATRGGNETEFQGAPNIVEPMKFVDYQRHKFVLNVGSNQGTFHLFFPKRFGNRRLPAETVL